MSKSTVSTVCKAIKDEFDVWKKRDLSDIALEYLFLDGSHFRYHDGARVCGGTVVASPVAGVSSRRWVRLATAAAARDGVEGVRAAMAPERFVDLERELVGDVITCPPVCPDRGRQGPGRPPAPEHPLPVAAGRR